MAPAASLPEQEFLLATRQKTGTPLYAPHTIDSGSFPILSHLVSIYQQYRYTNPLFICVVAKRLCNSYVIRLGVSFLLGIQ